MKFKKLFRWKVWQKKGPKIELVELPAIKLKNCQFLHNRYSILPKLKKSAVGAEIGVLGGDFSEAILKFCEPRELHLIDLFNCDDYAAKGRFTAGTNEKFIRSRFKEEIASDQIKVHKGYSWEKLSEFPDRFFDWLYIDAGHDYESVKKDLNEAGRVIKEDGIIIMNDYIMYDHISNIEYGVVQATNEFIMENRFEMIYFAFHPSLFCDVAIRKVNPRLK